MVAKSIISGLLNAKVSQSNPSITDGKYKLAVKNVFIKDGHKGTSFIAEFVVLDSSPIYVPDDVRNEEEISRDLKPLPPGTECGYVVNLTKNPDMGFNNTIATLQAIMGGAPDEDTLKTVIGQLETGEASTLFRGVIVNATTNRRLISKGPNAGKPFTAIKWGAVSQSPEEVKARAAEM